MIIIKPNNPRTEQGLKEMQKQNKTINKREHKPKHHQDITNSKCWVKRKQNYDTSVLEKNTKKCSKI